LIDIEKLKKIFDKEKKFSGKMLLTLSDLSFVKELIQLYHTGLLEDLIKKTLNDL